YAGGPVYNRSSPVAWVNTSAFGTPATGTIGNTTRNEFRGPGYQNWNLALFKNFHFKESMRLQVRLETFNTLNHVQYGGNTTGDPTQSNAGVNNQPGAYFGMLGGTRDPRQIQLGAKLYF